MSMDAPPVALIQRADTTPIAAPARPARLRIPLDLRQMVHDALSEVGGVDYLVEQARKNPKTFLQLVSRCIPQQASLTITQPTRDEIDSRLRSVGIDPDALWRRIA